MECTIVYIPLFKDDVVAMLYLIRTNETGPCNIKELFCIAKLQLKV